MANLLRVIIAALLVGFLPLPSYALVPLAAGYTCAIGNPDATRPSLQAAFSVCKPTFKYCGVARELPATSQVEVWGQDPAYAQFPNCEYATKSVISKVTACPANSTPSGGACACKEGYNETRGQCIKPDDRTPEQLCNDLAIGWNSTLTQDRSGRVAGNLTDFWDGAVVCRETDWDGGKVACKHRFTGDFGFKDDEEKSWVNGWSVALDSGDLQEAGGSLSCSASDEGEGGPKEPKANDRPKNCENGYKGTVNGVELCVEAWTGETEGVDWTRTNDAEGNETDSKTTVTCKGDQCTVKEEKTTKKPGGGTTTTTTTTENVNRQGYCAKNPEASICGRKEDDSGGSKGQGGKGGSGGGGKGEGEGICKENPDSPMCKKSTFGGSCAANFQCDGDAIQCAIAKEQHIRACKLFDDESPESKLYQDNKGKEGNQTKDLPGNDTISIAGRIDQSDALGGGGCIADVNVTVWKQSISLPFSAICSSLGYLGNVLLAVSFLLALRIVTRG